MTFGYGGSDTTGNLARSNALQVSTSSLALLASLAPTAARYRISSSRAGRPPFTHAAESYRKRATRRFGPRPGPAQCLASDAASEELGPSSAKSWGHQVNRAS
eukprot:10234459-Alexandrium_andersonii.AAC.2